MGKPVPGHLCVCNKYARQRTSRRLTNEGVSDRIKYTCFKMFNTTTQFPRWQLSHCLAKGLANFPGIWKRLFSVSNLLLQSKGIEKHLPCIWAICQ